MDNRHDQFRFDNIMEDAESSIMQKYQDLVIGERRLSSLIKYELTTFLLGNLPGATGLFLRRLFYPALFKRIGDKVVFGHHVTLRVPRRISIGNHVVIDDYAMLSARGVGKEGISIGDKVLIGRNSLIKTRSGSIQIKDNANIGSNCQVGSTSSVVIGRYCLLASGCYIGGMQHGFDRSDVPIVQQALNIKGGIRIEDDVWLGVNVVVNDGITIGQGSIIGAGSIVTKDIPPYSIAVGAPARVIKERKRSDSVNPESLNPEPLNL